MSRTGPLAYEHNGERITRERFYEIACDPRRSVAVEACAGAGKTWMLVSRILRALVAGAQPHEILAITFTKKAAGEMRKRLHDWLAKFALCTHAQLRQEFVIRGLAEPGEADVQAMQGMYASLLAGGRPVQIRTFHSWFAALLRNAPLAVLEQLRLPANYELLERDDEAIELLWRRFYAAVWSDDQARADYEASVASYGRSQTQKALRAALAKRVEFALADAHGVVEESVRHFAVQFGEFDGLAHPRDALARASMRERFFAASRALGRGTPSVAGKGSQLEAAVSGADLGAALDALLTKEGAPRKFSDKLEGIADVQAAQELAQRLSAACTQHEAWLHQQRMARLARMAIEEFAQLKRERGWIDMNDVERAALLMLSDPVLSGWVQQRLDARTRHLLIDEFQDTNPLQWQALHSWLQSYAGAGADAPSVFIVGDPKQSIYRFRRAEPQVFAAAKDFIAQTFDGDVLSCDHTHRNPPEVLDAVNRVMAAAQDEHQYEGFRAHTTESEVSGRVLALPRIERDAIVKPEAAASLEWRNSLTTPRELPEERLVALECRQAAAWIAGLIAQGTPPKDIMVLARRRERLTAMEEELRAIHVPTQQPEKSDLSDAPEVKDIAALLDVLVSTTHDLSLARVLKSPLFGMRDEALVEIALAARHARSEEKLPLSWYEILQRGDVSTPLREAGAQLAQWKQLVDRLPPHDALAAIYAQADVLARFGAASPAAMRALVLARLRALLGAALDFNGGRYPTPYAFVRALKAGGLEAPAAQGTDAVSLLTVHGAKGLEAPIVLILDTDAPPPRAETMGVVVEWPGEAPAPWRFSFIASESNPPPCNAHALEVERAARQREELNGLYVAMTRAEQQLVISSVAPRNSGNGSEGSWWQRLQPFAVPVEVEPAPSRPAAIDGQFVLPQVPALAIRAESPRAQDSLESSLTSRLGQAMHRLLETLAGPGVDAGAAFPPSQVRRVAREFALDERDAQHAARMAQRIVTGEGAWAWDMAVIDWHANEVPLHHGGELLRLDRLVRHAASGEWWVLDYKSAAQPQLQPDLVAQMQRYRAALEAIHSGAVVRAAFLTAQGRLVHVP
jgi:ATP-dependent helicase/nuclease subunit A